MLVKSAPLMISWHSIKATLKANQLTQPQLLPNAINKLPRLLPISQQSMTHLRVLQLALTTPHC